MSNIFGTEQVEQPPAKKKCLENATSKSRSNSSIVWDLYDRHPTDKTKAICKKCGQSKSRGGTTSSTFTTTGLMNHAKICNPVETMRLKDLQLQQREKNNVIFQFDSAPVGSSSMSKFSQPTVTTMFKAKEPWGYYHPKAIEEHRKLAELIAKSNLGYNMLQNDGIKDYVKDKVPQYTMPSRIFLSIKLFQ